VGIEDNFFDLGGQSLLATQLFSRLRTEFNVEISVRNIFEMTTVTRQAALITTIHLATQASESLTSSEKPEDALIEGEL
jgi:ABC-type transporter Mla maintaining outer membrane lipid asymmetry permease subunit MlaE